MTQEKLKTLIAGCLLQKYGHFCSILTSSSLLPVLSSTSVDVTYKRGKNNSGFFRICFSYQAGKPQKEQHQVSADSTSIGLPHPEGKKSSEPIVTASQFSTPSTSTAKGNQGVHSPSSVVCHQCSGHGSHSKAIILPTQRFCIVSVQFVLLTQGKEHVSRLLSRQLRPLDMLDIMWLGNRQRNIGNH